MRPKHHPDPRMNGWVGNYSRVFENPTIMKVTPVCAIVKYKTAFSRAIVTRTQSLSEVQAEIRATQNPQGRKNRRAEWNSPRLSDDRKRDFSVGSLRRSVVRRLFLRGRIRIFPLERFHDQSGLDRPSRYSNASRLAVNDRIHLLQVRSPRSAGDGGYFLADSAQIFSLTAVPNPVSTTRLRPGKLTYSSHDSCLSRCRGRFISSNRG